MAYVEAGEIDRLLVRAPRSFGSAENFNGGFVIAILKDWSDRRSAFAVMDEIGKKLSDLPGVRAFPILRQGVGRGCRKTGAVCPERPDI
jgi:multidrug efflux pump